MPRRKLSEYRAKMMLSATLDIEYVGWSVASEKDLKVIDGFESYVLKVDQAEKKRFKNGLVLLDIPKKELLTKLKALQKKGYDYFIVEPYSKHSQAQERYISISYDRSSTYVSYSSSGGVDIEENADTVKTTKIDNSTEWSELATQTGFNIAQLEAMLSLFKQEHFTLLEINTYILTKTKDIQLLDAAIEIDDTGSFFANGWSVDDLRSPMTPNKSSKSEDAVAELNDSSPASFNLSVLNPDGSIFLLLSGGGASVVVADEVHNHGYGKQIANYGEYSGNPTEHETYLYASALIDLLLESAAKKKVLFIGGAVANFTDIANTFAGIIRAIDDNATQMQLQGVKVFVRRGGPRQEIGLKRIRQALEGYSLLGEVYDPSTSIHEAVRVLIDEVKA